MLALDGPSKSFISYCLVSIYLIIKYLLNANYVSGTVLGAGTAMHQGDRLVPAFVELAVNRNRQ